MATKKRLVKCSCDESAHLRAALKIILRISSEVTNQPMVDDLAQITNVADQALKLKKLVGDPGVYRLPELDPETAGTRAFAAAVAMVTK